jgi:D-aminoacyl-tRNA deacylase
VRTVLQRVTRASVAVDGQIVGSIGAGLLALVGVAAGDGPADVAYTASKIRDGRIFGDDRGRMNRSLVDVAGALLVVSQFTLIGDVRHGRRPSFDGAAPPDEAHRWFDALVDDLRASGLAVETGRFQAHMHVTLENDGPVTVLIDSRRLF